MIKPFKHYSFWLPAMLFAGHQITQRLLHIPIPIADDYLDPFCFIPIALALLQIERHYLYKQDRLSTADAIVFTILAVVISEIILPYFKEDFVSDWLDGVAFGLGQGWWLLTRPPD
jgi:hypothetical protein